MLIRSCLDAPLSEHQLAVLRQLASDRPRAVILDRDGVLNVDRGYVHRFEDFVWMPGALDGLRYLHERGYLVIIATNQSGIGRGLYTETHFLNLMGLVADSVFAAGGRIDATYYCPHHPSDAVGDYLADCDCRKPRPGLLAMALCDAGIRPDQAVMIGDKSSDMRAARDVAMGACLYRGGNLRTFLSRRLRAFAAAR